jgi:hypothetical protein
VYLHVLLKLPSWKIVLFTLAGKISMSVCVLVAGKREDTVVLAVCRWLVKTHVLIDTRCRTFIKRWYKTKQLP